MGNIRKQGEFYRSILNLSNEKYLHSARDRFLIKIGTKCCFFKIKKVKSKWRQFEIDWTACQHDWSIILEIWRYKYWKKIGIQLLFGVATYWLGSYRKLIIIKIGYSTYTKKEVKLKVKQQKFIIVLQRWRIDNLKIKLY